MTIFNSNKLVRVLEEWARLTVGRSRHDFLRVMDYILNGESFLYINLVELFLEKTILNWGGNCYRLRQFWNITRFSGRPFSHARNSSFSQFLLPNAKGRLGIFQTWCLVASSYGERAHTLLRKRGQVFIFWKDDFSLQRKGCIAPKSLLVE